MSLSWFSVVCIFAPTSRRHFGRATDVHHRPVFGQRNSDKETALFHMATLRKKPTVTGRPAKSNLSVQIADELLVALEDSADTELRGIVRLRRDEPLTDEQLVGALRALNARRRSW